MLQGKRIAVVIPAFNAGERLACVLRALPDGIDECIVVDDGSHPGAQACLKPAGHADAGERIAWVRHDRNRGVGAAILTGYAEARRRGADVAVVMAADGQMDPADLPALLEPVLSGRAAYSKGDRLSHPDCPRVMPPARYAGNCCLTWLTRRVTGLDDLMDSQCGYTALRLDALDSLPLESLYPRYGFPNDLLAALAGAGLPVAQVVVAPVYRGEPSGLRPALALLVYPLILARGLWVRWLARRHAGAAVLDATGAAPRIAG
jgi:glycosyltransferase involved in cell wall biosynthesis